jgi:hypothetical protein
MIIKYLEIDRERRTQTTYACHVTSHDRVALASLRHLTCRSPRPTYGASTGPISRYSGPIILLVLALQVLLQLAQRLVPMRNLVLLHRIHLGIPSENRHRISGLLGMSAGGMCSRQPIPFVRLEYRIPTKHLVPTRRYNMPLGLPLEQDRFGRWVLSGRCGRVGERA